MCLMCGEIERCKIEGSEEAHRSAGVGSGISVWSIDNNHIKGWVGREEVRVQVEKLHFFVFLQRDFTAIPRVDVVDDE